nr:hypothetical protein [Tanacetum cinerariifolium]
MCKENVYGGVILAGRLKDNVVQVTTSNDRIMVLSVVINGETVNVISAYASQVGLSDAEKKSFWDVLDECPNEQRLIIRGDLNFHIRATTDGYARVHGGFGCGARNEEAHGILEFATTHDLVVANSFFKKCDAHLITFHSGGHNTQIGYLSVRRGDLRACKDCKAFPSEACSSQHALRLLELQPPRNFWVWRRTCQPVTLIICGIKDAAKDSLGMASVSARTHSTHRESWWFCEEVQTKVATKQSRFKELLSYREGNQEDIVMAKERYKVAKREAKIVVARGKDKTYEDLYKKLDSKEGANDIYKIAKARERRRDLGNVRCIKDEGGRTIVREEDIRKNGKDRESIFPLFSTSFLQTRVYPKEARK